MPGCQGPSSVRCLPGFVATGSSDFWSADLPAWHYLGVCSGLCLVWLFCRFVFHVVVYTMWLKRKTPFSVMPGGIAGGCPFGRACLGTGAIDLVGVLLALAVLLWIPIHILTFATRYAEDYKRQCTHFPRCLWNE